METLELLQSLRARGVELKAAGGKLHYRSAEPLTDAERDELRQHKSEFLRLLQATPPDRAGAVPRCRTCGRILGYLSNLLGACSQCEPDACDTPEGRAILEAHGEQVTPRSPATPLPDWLAQQAPRVHERMLAARIANDLPALRAALGAQSEALEAFLLEGEQALQAAGQDHPDYSRGLQRYQRSLKAYEALEHLRRALRGERYDRKALAEWVCAQLWQQGDVAGAYEVGAANLDGEED